MLTGLYTFRVLPILVIQPILKNTTTFHLLALFKEITDSSFIISQSKALMEGSLFRKNFHSVNSLNIKPTY